MKSNLTYSLNKPHQLISTVWQQYSWRIWICKETGEYNHKDVAKWKPIKKQNIYKSADGEGEKAELE